MTAVELKFNCFFLMPLLDAFPGRLREELEAAYAEDLDAVFDVAVVRAALEGRLRSLDYELHQVLLLTPSSPSTQSAHWKMLFPGHAFLLLQQISCCESWGRSFVASCLALGHHVTRLIWCTRDVRSEHPWGKSKSAASSRSAAAG